MSDTKSNVNVADQQHTMSTDVPANQQHNPTGDHNASLTTGADQRSGTPNNNTTEDVHTTESEGTGTGIPVVAMSGLTATSDTDNKLESHAVSAEGASVDSSKSYLCMKSKILIKIFKVIKKQSAPLKTHQHLKKQNGKTKEPNPGMRERKSGKKNLSRIRKINFKNILLRMD